MVPQITATQADLIVVGIGGNDAFTLNWPRRWKKHVRELIDAIRSKFPFTPIAFPNMPPIKEFQAFTPLIKFTIGNLVEILGDELAKVIREYDQVYYSSETLTLEEWMVKMNLKDKELSDFSAMGFILQN